METYVVRVWMPDRPGALGQVASRIGAVRGDVVGIDILERGAGRVIDELVVRLPDPSLVTLLVTEVRAVDGVAVEDVRRVADGLHDPLLGALEAVAAMVEAQARSDVEEALVVHASGELHADWVVVVDLDPTEPVVVAALGEHPSGPWLRAFVEGSRSSPPVPGGPTGPGGVAWAPLPRTPLTLVLGRSGRPVHELERRRLALLARIAGTRWSAAGGPVVSDPVPGEPVAGGPVASGCG